MAVHHLRHSDHRPGASGPIDHPRHAVLQSRAVAYRCRETPCAGSHGQFRRRYLEDDPGLGPACQVTKTSRAPSYIFFPIGFCLERLGEPSELVFRSLPRRPQRRVGQSSFQHVSSERHTDGGLCFADCQQLGAERVV